MGRLLNWEN